MCNIFDRRIMENYQGDLSDIIRGSGASSSFSSDQWQFSSNVPMMNNFSSVLEDTSGNFYFGDPFSNMRDPFLHELDIPGSVTACFNGAVGGGSSSSNNCVLEEKKIVEDDDDMMMRKNNNCILSNMIQISPRDSPVISASSNEGKNMVSAIAKTSKDRCLVDNNTGVVQISSPRNPALNKRRKSQTKKSICIPAPAAPNSRQSGEVVPSDLWAWRKYGQKPIKGSPYPRGYYRCSSSKGCPARKQVERSRTDPNMLVITYTSEHNHPWPTQRNALAGSIRSQSSKNNLNSDSNKNPESTTTTLPQSGTTLKPEEDLQESNSDSIDNKAEEIEKQIGIVDDGEFAELCEIKADHQGFSNAVDVDDQEMDDSKGLDPLFHLFDWSFDNSSTKYHLI